MPDYETLSQLLDAQTERKLTKIRDGIVSKIDQLRTELQMVDAAIMRKRPKVRADAVTTSEGTKTRNGQLSRIELLRYVAEEGRPVKAGDMREVLAAKGILRRTEAIRNSLVRLEADGKLRRDADGSFVVVGTDDDGAETERRSGGSVSEVEGTVHSPDA